MTFRKLLIEAQMDRRLVERTIERASRRQAADLTGRIGEQSFVGSPTDSRIPLIF
ncbi:MAG: hypothetical protein ACJ8BW_39115 [Ktedonobacteraceae bacterium]